MRILWVVNMVLPQLADYLKIETSASGTWMFDLSQRIADSQDIELAVVAVSGTELRKINLNNITFYLLPGTGKNMLFYTKKFEKIWDKIYDDFKPHIVHLHGTEYSHGLALLRRYPDVKFIVSIQGILNKIKGVSLGNLSFLQTLFYRTISENFKLNGMLEKHLLLNYNAKYEKEIIERANYANTVNYWDTSVVKVMNPNIKFFNIEYNLRNEYYISTKWSISKIHRKSIFTSPANSPMKGLHILLKALEIIRKYEPEVVLFVPGFRSENGKLVVTDGYSKYISSLVKKMRIESNIRFLGRQSTGEMINQVLNANVVVVPSSIEGTSLVLREAMFLGAPCVASFRGGMADFICDKHDGFLYDYPEYEYLAFRVLDLFEDDELCVKISKNAISKAEIAHNRDQNMEKYIRMYKEII